MKKIIYTLAFVAAALSSAHAQNVGIGTNIPNASAKLDVTSTNSGILIPRVALTMTTAAGPVAAPVNSLLVYNTATAGDVTPGFYHWSSTTSTWVRLTDKAGWEITGNTGIGAANFLGTINNADLMFRTNNTEKMRILANGNVGMGLTNPAYGLELNGSFGFGNGTAGSYRSRTETRDNAGQQATQSGFFETAAPVNYPTGAASWWHLIDSRHSNNGNNYALQISGSFFDQELWFRKTNNNGAQAWSRLLSSTTGWTIVGNSGTNAGTNFVGTIDAVDFVTRTNNTEQMRVTTAGYVGIGTAAPGEVLSVYRAVGGWQNRFSNNSGTGADVYLAHGGGYGIHVRGWNNSDAVYSMEMYNNASLMNAFYNSGRVILGMINNVGIGIAAPTQKLDVQNGNARINNTFHGDVGHGAGWGGWSHSLQNNTTGYGLLQSNDGAFTLINKQNTGGGYIGFRVANVDQAVILNNGYMGVGTTAPTARLHVLGDENNLPVIYGRNTNNTAATTSFGVRGECGSTGLGSAGVSGVSINSSQNEIGVVGDYALWGAALFGLGWAAAYTDMPTTRDFGVFGTVNYWTGTGVYGRNTDLSVGSAYGMYCNGNFAVTGAKSASVPTSKGNQLVFSTESPEIWFEDLGFAKLQNGSIHISLDEMFHETVFISEEHPMHVFLQEQGDCNGLYFIPDADGKGFTVKEKQAGTSNTGFSYRIMAKRRFYQDQRFGVDANQPLEDNASKAKYQEPSTTDPNVMQQLIDKSIREKEASAGYTKGK